LDAGLFGPAERRGRRLLLVSNNAAVPETTSPLNEMPGFPALRDRFDGVLSWNEAIAPFHPSGWAPRLDDEPLWERHLRLLWGLGDDEIELAVESIQVEPALAVVRIFHAAPVDVYADGLMSYGPTRNRLEPLVSTRVRRLLHLDLVPGLRPLLLSEFGVEPRIVPEEAFREVLEQVAARSPEEEPPGLPERERPALLLGQYLSALSILTAQEEEQLHVRMVLSVAARGHRRAVFKPHPTAPARWSALLEKEAADLGVELRVVQTPVLAEVLFQRLRPALVVGCFSTALVTASALYGLEVARTGTGLVLGRLTPYQNSNRVPLVIADAMLPSLDEDSPAPLPAAELTALVRTVGYCMQPSAYPQLREEALRYLASRPKVRAGRYFRRRRLAALALPGGVPAPLAFLPRNRLVRRAYRRVRALRVRAQPAPDANQRTGAAG
jgi:hypothetical protein